MDKTVVVGFHGGYGVGKDTAADLLMLHSTVGSCATRIAMADAVYAEVAQVFDVHESFLRDRNTKTQRQGALRPDCCLDRAFAELLRQRDPESTSLGATGRTILELYGTDYRLAQDPTYWATLWVEAATKAIEHDNATLIVCPDVRWPGGHLDGDLPVEVAALFRVGADETLVVEVSKDSANEAGRGYVTQRLPDECISDRIENNGSLYDLSTAVRKLANDNKLFGYDVEDVAEEDVTTYLQALDMLRRQEGLNQLVHSDWRSQSYPFHIAVVAEVGEALAHASWEWWSSRTGDYRKLVAELVDVWHFGLSMMLESKLYGEETPAECAIRIMEEFRDQARHPKSDQSAAELLCAVAAKSVSNGVRRGLFSYPNFIAVLRKIGLSPQELYLQYVAKNALNRVRQEQGYKNGRYRKLWSLPDGEQVKDADYVYGMVAASVKPLSAIYASGGPDAVFRELVNSIESAYITFAP